SIGNVKAIATGRNHVVALKQDGTVLAWGDNISGQGGNGGNINCMKPTQVPGLRDVAAITAGQFTTYALKNDGSVWSWGYNGSGQLGNDEHELNSKTPVRVAGLDNVRAVAAGDSHVVALKQDGTVWAWGNNRASQFARKTFSYSAPPERVKEINNVPNKTAP